MKYDLHIHSIYSSDGILSPDIIIKAAIKKGLDGIAIIDHNTIKGGLKAKEFETEGLEVIVGAEIMTDRGEIIGLFLEEEINKSSNFYDIIAGIKEQDGIVIIPHPFDEIRHSAFLPEKDDVCFIDCIEGFNSRCIFQKYNDMAIDFGKKNDIAICAGSDAHFLGEIGNAGIITQQNDLREAIRKKDMNIFGKRSSMINHIKTKLIKIKRRGLSLP
jgi:predicted metal-dependent phosphoesterase TrpH